MTHHQFQVAGMSCGHCARAIESSLQSVDPQAQVKVDLAQRRVEVDSSQSPQALAAAIVEAGYTVE